MADELLFPGVPRPQGYVPTPQTVYDYANYGEWWKSKWTGPAWCCPQGHQMPQAKFDWGLYGGNPYGTFCPGCGKWVDRKDMMWDPTEKRRTMGYAIRKSDLEEMVEATEEQKTEESKEKTREYALNYFNGVTNLA